MKLSIIFAIYQSQEALNRQARYYAKMNLPRDIEFIFVDDGTTPPLTIPSVDLNATVYQTNDFRPWTQGLARNFGVKMSTGVNILCSDIDHILSKEAIMACYNYLGFRMMFPRYIAVLTEDGELLQDYPTLIANGAIPERINSKRGLYSSYHGNTYCMPRELFWFLGGNDVSHCTYGHYAPDRKGEDCAMNQKWNRWAYANDIHPDVGPPIYTFIKDKYHINNDPNPYGLFHSLSKELKVQPLKK